MSELRLDANVDRGQIPERPRAVPLLSELSDGVQNTVRRCEKPVNPTYLLLITGDSATFSVALPVVVSNNATWHGALR